ncbi:MAG: hypothetical protein QOD56_1467 [Gammaproteobacteria bacterium]|jgi:hypothetical protein|nr:hypothetical protein [Gammaproteobacteria bacterium]
MWAGSLWEARRLQEFWSGPMDCFGLILLSFFIVFLWAFNFTNFF